MWCECEYEQRCIHGGLCKARNYLQSQFTPSKLARTSLHVLNKYAERHVSAEYGTKFGDVVSLAYQTREKESKQIRHHMQKASWRQDAESVHFG
jgi:hypothetical protein